MHHPSGLLAGFGEAFLERFLRALGRKNPVPVIFPGSGCGRRLPDIRVSAFAPYGEDGSSMSAVNNRN